ncbi:hypothetical protein [uncultured Polaribacter sp.]|uniref:hypothetical protein n=1 Tax=uncultured Polaribacter sp. TaxID=174711 RepID=UPI002605AFC3|nr:hypothetical protein [uncultured Polaribacter sp.]
MRVFKEEQRFTQIWLLVIMGFSVVAPLYLIIREYNAMSTLAFGLTIFGVLLSFGLIFLFKLKTRIDEKGIHYQFFPFHLKYKTIKWNEIEKAYVRIYDPIGDYGGWGIKGGALWNKAKGKCVNVSGDIGLQLELKNGKKLLIGTQEKTAVTAILKTYFKKNNEQSE